MSEKCFCHFNGYAVKDAKARASIEELEQRFITPEKFGAVGDGVNDDTAAMENALASFGESGGVLYLPANKRYLITRNIAIHDRVSVVGESEFKGDPQGEFIDECAYYKYGSSLVLDGGTVYLQNSSSLKNCLLYKKGIDFPSSDASKFSGTALGISGDDCTVENVMILGFNLAITSTAVTRCVYNRVFIDCVNGIEIKGAPDIIRIEDVHCYPFLTTPHESTDVSKNYRDGIAFYLHDGVDLPFLSDCFSYGYKVGFKFANMSTPMLVNCMSDGKREQGVTIGFVFTDFVLSPMLVNCCSYNRQHGIYIDNTHDSLPATCSIVNYLGSGCENGVALLNGECLLTNSVLKGNDTGLTQIEGRANITNTYFKSNTLSINARQMYNVKLCNNNYDLSVGGSIVANSSIKSVTSSDPLQVDANDEILRVTGTTGFSHIASGWAGRKLTLIFDDVLTLWDSEKLAIGEDITTHNNMVVNLLYDGSKWLKV